MVKKTKLKKINKLNIKKKIEKPSKEEIEKLRKNLQPKNDINNSKSKKDDKKKIPTTKKKIKLKEKVKIKFKLKHPKHKKKFGKEKEKEKENENEKTDDLNLPKKNGSKKILPEKKYTGPTILELIRNKENLQEVKLIDGTVNTKSKNNKKKELQKKDLTEKKKIIAKKEEMEKKEFLKKIKRRIKMENGRIIYEAVDPGTKLNEQNNKEKEKEKDLIQKEIIYEGDDENINSLTYLKDKIKPKKWSDEETKQFYKALILFGLDFSFLEIVLKPRIREEIKRKYLKEKRYKSKLIEKIISVRKNPDIMNDILTLYKKQNNINSLNLSSKQDSLGLGLIRGESSKRTIKTEKEDSIDYNKEYKDILNKLDKVLNDILIKN